MRFSRTGALVLVAAACSRRDTANDTPADASTSSAPAEPSGTATELRVAPPRAYADTPLDELGTLPSGVGVAVGQRAPALELPDQEGKRVKLADLLAKSEVLLVFYRGGW